MSNEKIKPINLELSDNIKRVIKDQKYYQELLYKSTHNMQIPINKHGK